MKRLTWMSVAGLVLAAAIGCGGSPKEGTQAATGGATPVAAPTTPAMSASATPAEVVARFYDALKNGEEPALAALLTDKAREETAKSGLDIKSQGSTTLSYKVGETELVDEQGTGAHVKTQWTETDADGSSASTEVVWVLRKQANGWRIAGMATRLGEGQSPVLFNFEDPEDMMRKRDAIAGETSTSEEPAAQQAAVPSDPSAGDSQMR